MATHITSLPVISQFIYLPHSWLPLCVMHCRRPQQSVRLWQDQREPLREHPSPTGSWDCRDNLETIFSQVEAVLLQTRHPHPLELNSITFLQETPDALIHRISALEIVLAETKGNAGNSSLPFV